MKSEQVCEHCHGWCCEHQANEKLYIRAISTFGKLTQTTVAIEELSELVKAITKQMRGFDYKASIAEEIADCEIMLEQMPLIFGIDRARILEIKSAKLKRLEMQLE